MNKRILLCVAVVAAAVLSACRSDRARISGRFVGSDGGRVYLEQVAALRQAVIDSAVLEEDGSYRFELRDVSATPSLYNVICNGERIPLLLAGGDRVKLGSVGSVIRNYTVEGSAESELLRTFYQPYVAGARRLDEIAAGFGRADAPLRTMESTTAWLRSPLPNIAASPKSSSRGAKPSIRPAVVGPQAPTAIPCWPGVGPA